MSALASASADVDVAVIGAGVAGLAAAGHLRAAGLRVALLEAGSRIGGRAFTDHPDELGGHAFDHGASWLHAAHRNPIVTLARARGEMVGPDTPWEGRMRVMDPPGVPADVDAYTRAEAAWREAVTARLDGADCSLSDAAAGVANDPWTATIETWEGAIIAAGDADELSLADWHANELDGENYVTPGGLGALIARLLATPARLCVAVTRIAARADGVQVHTTDGTLLAGATIVTVSTGVLRDERIRFDPGLPQDILAALDGLPMGLLSKIALRANCADRLGLPPGAGVFRRLGVRGAAFLSTVFWGGGTDLAVGFVGGRAAWTLAHDRAEAGAFMRAELAAAFGHDISWLFGGSTFTTNWGADPLFQGAYAYARPGRAGARAVLGTPLWDGRLLFAGEALATNGLAGTVAGAYETGLAAAQRILDGFTATRACV
jgi:monoamine oxidase